MNIPSVQSKGAAPTPPAANVPPQQAAERRQLLKATDTLNSSQTFGENNELVFVFDRTSHRPIMRVVDKKTNDVIMQLPPDYVLQLADDAEQNQQRKQEQARE